MENTLFEEYSFSEFVQEFFKTLGEVLFGLSNAFTHIFNDIGPLKVFLAAYIFLLLLAVVSELKKFHRKREAQHRAYQAAFEERQAEERRRREERDERIAQYKQRDLKKKTGNKVPTDALLNYQQQRHGRR